MAEGRTLIIEHQGGDIWAYGLAAASGSMAVAGHVVWHQGTGTCEPLGHERHLCRTAALLLCWTGHGERLTYHLPTRQLSNE